MLVEHDVDRGLDALRAAVQAALCTPVPAPLGPLGVLGARVLHTEASAAPGPGTAGHQGLPGRGPGFGDADRAASSEASEAERTRLIALVDLARTGDREAFGLLFDHYHPSVYRFLYYRTRSATLAEDLASDTFFRALRSMNGFRWQGKDFGAWLMTIARNLATDHARAGCTRLEMTTDDMSAHDDTTEGPEAEVLARLTRDVLLRALEELPDEQRDCLVMRFLQGLSISETASVLRRSDGAVKQLQLRGVRNLAKRLPEGVRP